MAYRPENLNDDIWYFINTLIYLLIILSEKYNVRSTLRPKSA